MTEKNRNSQISGFYRLPLEKKHQLIRERGFLEERDLVQLSQRSGFSLEQAEHMVENVIGLYPLPLGVALNFQVNGRDVLIPMVIEEPSVVAGASFMAKLVRQGGGFSARAAEPLMIGQLQVLDVRDVDDAAAEITARKDQLLMMLEQVDPVLSRLGGGPRDLEVRIIERSAVGAFLVIHLIFDVRDAMGANAVNTACEKLAPRVEAMTGGRVHLRILSNLADRRLAAAECTIPVEVLAFEGYGGEEVRDGIVEAWAFADADPYRAATHNKGIMNGVDAVVLATGNDWRAVEAGAHAYAARGGRYQSLSRWSVDDQGNLHGQLEMPLAVGIVGGATGVHPGAQTALKMMEVRSAAELSEIIAAVGLAQNLAALRALATEGIQKGHMSLHARQIAMAAGAKGEEIPRLSEQMIQEQHIRPERAAAILQSWRKAADLKEKDTG